MEVVMPSLEEQLYRIVKMAVRKSKEPGTRNIGSSAVVEEAVRKIIFLFNNQANEEVNHGKEKEATVDSRGY